MRRPCKVIYKDAQYDGFVLEFGSDWEELRDGVGQYPAAIVEGPSGRLDTIPVACITMSDVESPVETSHNGSVEGLWHFRCGSCGGWWSIGDWKAADSLCCPHCGKRGGIRNAD